MGAYDKFTRRAKQVLSLAQQEARYFNHPYVGTEHILLGLIREGEGVAARVLQELGIQHHKARSAVEFIVGYGEGAPHAGEMELAVGAKRVIEYAIEEAAKLKHHYIGTEHLLLGLARLQEGVAAGVFDIMSVGREHVRNHVMRMLRAGSNAEPRPAPWEAAPEAQEAGAPTTLGELTRRAKQVLRLAQEEARHFNHPYVGTEHILLGLIREGEGVGAHVLAELGVQLHKTRSAVEFIVGHGEGPLPDGELDLTTRAKKMMEYAVEEAKKLNHHYIGTEHLLLGLVRNGEGVATGVLDIMSVSLEQVRTQVMRMLHVGSGTATPAPPALPARQKGRARRAKASPPPLPGVEPLPLPFSERLRGVVGFARQEALALQHDKVDTPHLLLGLLRDAGDQVSELLERHGLSVEQVREATRGLIPAVEERAGATEPPEDVAWRAREAVLYAAYETAIFAERVISDGHLLLGLIRLEELGDRGILRELGLDPATLRSELMRILGRMRGQQPGQEAPPASDSSS